MSPSRTRRELISVPREIRIRLLVAVGLTLLRLLALQFEGLLRRKRRIASRIQW